MVKTQMSQEVLNRIIKSYQAYYDLNETTPEKPFVAEASFHSHDDAFFLVHSAVIGESESNEYVFFALENELDAEKLTQLDAIAWNKGTARVKPHKHHRNTDITLIIVADSIPDEVKQKAKSLKHYKNYVFYLQGFSHYRLIIVDTSKKEVIGNRMGKMMSKNIRKSLSQLFAK